MFKTFVIQVLSLQKRICVNRQTGPSKVKVSTGTSKTSFIAQPLYNLLFSTSKFLHSRKIIFRITFVCGTFICRVRFIAFPFIIP